MNNNQTFYHTTEKICKKIITNCTIFFFKCPRASRALGVPWTLAYRHRAKCLPPIFNDVSSACITLLIFKNPIKTPGNILRHVLF